MGARIRSSRWIPAAAATAALLAGGQLAAQETGRWIVDANGGVSLPAGDLEDVYDVGGRVGIGIGYLVAPRVAIRVDGDVDFLTGSDDAPGAPNLRLWHYGAGVSVNLLDPDRTRWTLLVDAGAGATTMDSDDFPAEAVGQEDSFTETYFQLNGGLQVGYLVTERVNLFAGGRANVAFTDEEDTALLTQFLGTAEGFDTAWTIPIVAGIEIRI